MLQSRLNRFIDSLRVGASAGFVSGLVIDFLILLGIPINIRNIALLLLLLVVGIFGSRLARQLRDQGVFHLVKNALVLGIVASILPFLLMSLIDGWLERGVNIKTYFHSVSAETMEVLSGVPQTELHPNPARDILTGEYPEGARLRTNPMRLTFDDETGLRLLDVNLIIGGFYGFMVLLIIMSVASALGTWALAVANVGQHWARLKHRVSGTPQAHGLLLVLPAFFFALLWLTVGHGSYNSSIRSYSVLDPVIALGRGAQEIQLLLGFAIILFSLVAVRAARPTDWELDYRRRAAIMLGIVVFMTALGVWRITGSGTYFIATSSALRGSETLSVAVTVLVGVLLAAQNVFALRTAGRFETQLSSTISMFAVLLMPLYLNQGQNDVMTIVGINVMLGLGLNIVVGYAGLLDLGYVAFFAIGAYTYAFLSSNQLRLDSNNQPAGLKFAGNDEMVVTLAGWVLITVVVTLLVVIVGLRMWRQRVPNPIVRQRSPLITVPARPGGTVTALLTIVAIGSSAIIATLLDNTGAFQDIFSVVPPFLVGLTVGVVMAGLSGIALGIPVLRLRGDYLAIVTLGFGEIIRLLFTNLRDYTGGPQGVLEIPRPLPQGVTGGVGYLAMIYMVFLGAGLVAFFSMRLKMSRTGRAWSAMKSDEDIAQSVGIHLVQSKLMAFAIGAAFAGIGGVLFAARQRNIYPNDFTLDISIEVLSLVIIGGMGSIPGVIMGAIALIGVPEVLRELSQYRILAFGALLVTMVIIRPEGLLPAPAPKLRAKAHALVHGQSDAQAQEDGQV